jgi:hypothetical protein
MTQHLSGFEYFWILSKHAGMPLAAAQKRFSEMERPDSSRRDLPVSRRPRIGSKEDEMQCGKP